MSVSYKASLMFGAKFTNEEREKMLALCDYKYEDDFMPIMAYYPEESDYIFGYEITTCEMGTARSFDEMNFPYFTATHYADMLCSKLKEMGIDEIPHFDFYIVGQVL